MKTQIKYTGIDGKVLIAWGAEGITAAQIAKGIGLSKSEWQEISAEEAAQIAQGTLEEIKERAKAELKAYRQKIEASGFTFMGQHWDSEQKDELRLNSAYKIFEAGLTEYPGWKISDGVYVTLTLEILQGASMAFMQHTGNAFAIEVQKLAEIEALNSVGTVLTWLENDLKEGWNSTEIIEE